MIMIPDILEIVQVDPRLVRESGNTSLKNPKVILTIHIPVRANRIWFFPTERPRTRKVVRSPAASLGIGKLVQSEIDLRKKESLGMAPVKGGGRTLGTGTLDSVRSLHNVAKGTYPLTPPPAERWTCLVCTLYYQ
jgi:hypothetical protein